MKSFKKLFTQEKIEKIGYVVAGMIVVLALRLLLEVITNPGSMLI